MVAGNLALVLRATGPYPFSDEVFLLTESITFEWLWRLHAEHRVPLAKFIWLGVLRVSGYDFRAGNVVSVLSVAATAAAMVAGAGRLRGRARYSDAFFPLVMLSFGQIQNFLWWWVFNHILPNLVACGLLLAIVFRGRDPRLRDSILISGLLAILFLAGPIGLPYLLGFGAWLGYRAVLLWRAPSGPDDVRDGLITLGLATILAALVGLYFVGYDVEPGTAAGVPVPETGPVEELKTSLRILAVSFGPRVTPYVRPVALTLLGISLASAAALLRAWFVEPGERLRSSGLLMFLGAMWGLVLLVGRSRAGMGWEYHLFGVYLNMAIPGLCAIYFTWILYGGRALGSLIQVMFFTLACFFFLPNYERALGYAQHWRDAHRDVEQDIRAGVPPFILAERHNLALGLAPPHVEVEEFAQALRTYKELDIPQFRAMASDPVFHEVKLPIEPSNLDEIAWEDGVAYSRSHIPEGAALGYSLDRPRFVYAIRLKFRYEGDPEGVAHMRLDWGDSPPGAGEEGGDPGGEHGERLWFTKTPYRMPGEWGDRLSDDPDQTRTFWVNSEIDRFRIYPDTNPFAFTLSEIELLVP